MKAMRNHQSKLKVPNTDRTMQFSAIVLIVNWAVPITLYVRGDGNFSLMFFCMLGLAILHSFSIWYLFQHVHQSQRVILHEIQEMLQDLIRNQLAIIVLSLSGALQSDPEKVEKAQVCKQRITQSVQHITAVIDNLSMGTLEEWKRSRS